MTKTPNGQAPRYPVRLVALRTGLTPHVLRAWERRYGVVTPTRTGGGQRLYSQLDIERLSRLRRLTARGHTISHLARLDVADLARLEEESGTEALPAPQPDAEVARPSEGSVADVSAAALRATRRFDALELQTTLERAAVTLGVPEFLDEVVAPVLEEIGRGWRERSISIAQEHMATAVFRRVLGWLLGVYENDGAAPRLIVATPRGQTHELGALMVAVSAAAEGWAVTYLGPDLPVDDLLSAAAETDAQAVAISVVHVPDQRDIAAALSETRGGLPARVPLLLGGAAASTIELERELTGTMVIDSLAELRVVLRHLDRAGPA
jgi:DNA-binding transcriptional MerR regulator/methylmalonyl-CoA mutase cobalamin-binding subunit